MSSAVETSRFEQVALTLMRFANERDLPKRLQYRFLRTITQFWVYRTIHRRLLVDGVDMLKELDPDRGVVMVSNHRTFFDQYVMMLCLYEANVDWAERLFFPIRAKFFYERPAGLLLNMLIGGGAMYPPIFRDRSRSQQNKVTLEQLATYLQRRGTLVGIHPEGTRGKGPDPYELLPAQPGVGQVILRAHPIVIPLFLNGISNQMLRETQKNYQANIGQTDPVIACFGAPVDYSEYTAKKPRAALYKRVADKTRDAITALGQREQAIRAACFAGEVSETDPRWLHQIHRR